MNAQIYPFQRRTHSTRAGLCSPAALTAGYVSTVLAWQAYLLRATLAVWKGLAK